MNNMAGGTKKLQFRRRIALLAAYGIGAMAVGIAIAAAPVGAGRGASTPSTPANKAAAEAQFEKADALRKQGKYAEAQVENEKALALDPTNYDAVLLRTVLQKLLAGNGGSGTPGSMTQMAGATGGGLTGKIPLLTTQQVSLIRLMELGSADNRVTGRIDAKVLEDFWQNVVTKDPQADKSKARHDAFVSTTANNFPGQVKAIRNSNDPKYMGQVTITSEPATLLAFKNSVHTYVLQNCATSECHGGDKGLGGNFRLINPATSTEQQYTNFYIMSSYANADGKMIDRDAPEKSLFLQYGLPYASASIKHPKMEERKLTGPNDPKLRPMFEWVKALTFPKPNYGINYDLPGGTYVPASAPATSTPSTTTAPATTRATAPSK